MDFVLRKANLLAVFSGAPAGDKGVVVPVAVDQPGRPDVVSFSQIYIIF